MKLRSIIFFPLLYLGMTVLPGTVNGQDTNYIRLTNEVDIAITSNIAFNRNLVQYGTYEFEITFLQNGTAYDVSAASVNLYCKESLTLPDYVFQSTGWIEDGPAGIAIFPIGPGLLSSTGRLNFEFVVTVPSSSPAGTPATTRITSQIYTEIATYNPGDPPWIPPTPEDSYYTKEEIDAMLLIYAQTQRSETWADTTIVATDQFHTRRITHTDGAGSDIDFISGFNAAATANFNNVTKAAIFDGPVDFNYPVNITAGGDLTVDGDTYINGLLDVTGAFIRGNIVNTDSIASKTAAVATVSEGGIVAPLAAGDISIDSPSVFTENLTSHVRTTPGFVIGSYGRSAPTFGIHADNTDPIIHLFNDNPDTVADIYHFTGVTTNSNVRIRWQWADTTNTTRQIYMGDSTARDFIRFYSSGVPLVTGASLPDVAAIGAGSGDWVFTNPTWFENNTYFKQSQISSTGSFYSRGSLAQFRYYSRVDGDNSYLQLVSDSDATYSWKFPSTNTAVSSYRLLDVAPVNFRTMSLVNSAANIPDGGNIQYRFAQRAKGTTNAVFLIGSTTEQDYIQIYGSSAPVVWGTGTPTTDLTDNRQVVFTDAVTFEGTTSYPGGLGDLTVGDLTGSTDPWTLSATGDLHLNVTATNQVKLGTGTNVQVVIPYSGTENNEIWIGGDGNGIPIFGQNPLAAGPTFHFFRSSWGDPVTDVKFGLSSVNKGYDFYHYDSGGTGRYLRLQSSGTNDYHRIEPQGMPLAIGNLVPTTSASAGPGDVIITNPVFAESSIQLAGNLTRTNGGIGEWVIGRYNKSAPTITLHDDYASNVAYFMNDVPAGVENLFIGQGAKAPSGLMTRFFVGNGINSTTAFLQIGDTTQRDYIRLRAFTVPLVIGENLMTVAAGAGETVISNKLWVQSTSEFVGDTVFASISGTTTSPLVIKNGSQPVQFDVQNLEIFDRTDGDRGHNFYADNGNVYFTKDGADPSLDPAYVYFYPATAGLGGDKGVRGVSYNPNIGESRPGGEGVWYRWHLPATDGTSTNYLQFGSDTAEDYLRFAGSATAPPILFGTGSLTAGSITPTKETVGFSENVVIEGDLEVKGDVYTTAGGTDAKIAYAYTPGGASTDEVLIQFGETVLTGGSVTVPLGIAYKDTSYMVIATYQGASASNWTPISYQVVDADHVTLNGQAGETVSYQTTGFVTP